MAGSLAITSVMVWPRARAKRARQPQRSTTADMTRDPARPTAGAISGQAARRRSTRTLARRRRCAHQGTASTKVARTRTRGNGPCAGPARGGGGQPSARSRDDGHGVGAFGPGGEAEAFPREADHGEGGGGAGQGWPPRGVGGVADPGGDPGQACGGEGGEFGAVAPQEAGEGDDDDVGERVAGVHDDHGLHAVAAHFPGRAAHPAGIGHESPRGRPKP